MSAFEIFSSEFLGTALMICVATMVCGAGSLRGSKAKAAGWVFTSLGWGLAVYVGVYGAWKTGGHLNPSVTMAKVFAHAFDPTVTLNSAALSKGGIPVTFGNVMLYLAGQFTGAFSGALVGYLALKDQYDQDLEPEIKLSTFCTVPAIRHYSQNLLGEIICTTVLILWITTQGGTMTQVGPLASALVITVLVMAMGPITGAAMNPARDLMPRLVHQLAPIKGKGSSDWSYAWVPTVGPIIGAAVGVLVAFVLGMAA